jgi:putative N6-adenine-specific DNA methylase
LYSIPDCQSIIKKAAVERLKQKYHIEWFEETGAVHQIQFSIFKDEVSIMLDTSGEGLHKRGYRKNSTEAPIKETLAAGMLDIARVFPDTIFCDPFCGSGTFAIEAATKALNIAPGLNRKFAIENWDIVDKSIFANERTRALDLIRHDTTFKGYGFDIDSDAVELSEMNANLAGVGDKLKFTSRSIDDFVASEHLTLVMCNPPYGERLLELSEAEKLYEKIGDVFKKTGSTSYYIISPHEEFEKFYGIKADKRRKLYNGMIKCQMYMYFK